MRRFGLQQGGFGGTLLCPHKILRVRADTGIHILPVDLSPRGKQQGIAANHILPHRQILERSVQSFAGIVQNLVFGLDVKLNCAHVRQRSRLQLPVLRGTEGHLQGGYNLPRDSLLDRERILNGSSIFIAPNQPVVLWIDELCR